MRAKCLLENLNGKDNSEDLEVNCRINIKMGRRKLDLKGVN
jgi:hypothetical protein